MEDNPMKSNYGEVPINQIILDNPPDWHSYKSNRNVAIYILAFLVPMYLWVFWDGVTTKSIIFACYFTSFILLMAWTPFRLMLGVNKNRPRRVMLYDSGLSIDLGRESPQEFHWSDVRGVLVPYAPTRYSFMGKAIELHGMLVLSKGEPLKVSYQIAKEVSEWYKARFGVYPAKYDGEWGNTRYYKALQK